MGFFSDLFGGGESAADARKPYQEYAAQLGRISPLLEKYLAESQGYLSPYEKVGRSAMNQYYGELNKMGDPTSFVNNILSHYQESPAVQFQKSQGINSLRNLEEAKGLMGSGDEMKDVMKYSQGLASQGQQQYLQNVLGVQGSQLAGLRGLTGQGMGAAEQMGQWGMGTGQDIGSIMGQQAQAGLSGNLAAEKARAAHSSFLQRLLGAGIGGLEDLFGAGGAGRNYLSSLFGGSRGNQGEWGGAWPGANGGGIQYLS
jgi:hypothetical protein